jgi:hypothetical protein
LEEQPGVLFQLMRKYPLQGAFSYALGKQTYEKAVPGNSELVYESSNGDSWSLTRDPATGARAVMHHPNPQSGGQVSFIEVEKFLSDGTNGPEHQALKRLMEKNVRLPSIIVAYDIHPPKGEAYENLIEAIRSLGVWWHHLDTVWNVRCAHTPAEIRDRLKSHIGTEDQLLIVDISGDVAGWAGVNDTGSKWLAQNI